MHKRRKNAQMAIPQVCKTQLQETIERGQFYDIKEDDLLKQIGSAFSEELERLKKADVPENSSLISRMMNGLQRRHSPSQIIYGTNYDEINRTLVGVLALRWIHNDEYERFTEGQPEHSRLRSESFQWLKDLFERGLQSSNDLFALVISMIINDLGKDPNLEEDYYHQTRIRLPEQNHDSILLEAAKVGLVPCLDMLDEPHRSDVMLGLELGSELNAGQLAQAESVPINLEGLLQMRGHEHAYELKFMEQILDVAGAAGHIDSNGAKNLIEPVFQAFKTVHEVSLDIIEGRSNLRQGYDKVLTKRGDMLRGKGFRRLSVSDREERALLRLLTMGRTSDREQADLFQRAFQALDKKNKEILVNGLNIDGNVNETAVLPYYMPAIISETLETTNDAPDADRERALMSIMRYLARVLENSSSSQLSGVPGNFESEMTPTPGIVIEHNMMKAREVIGSASFRKNPDKLDELDIPKGQLLQRRRTSRSLESQP